ncbi:MAG: hypothetical protein ACI8XO_003400 [Verrucomicrobiales bacterium]|jgi:hypothetical protein
MAEPWGLRNWSERLHQVWLLCKHQFGTTFSVIVGSVSGIVLTQVGFTEPVVSGNYVPNDYIKFNFDTPLTLSPNSLYTFMWGSTASGFVSVNNLNDSTYARGTDSRRQ